MKYVIIVILVLIFTNPRLEDHQRTMIDLYFKYVQNKPEGFLENLTYNISGGDQKIINDLNAAVGRKNYILFSVGYLKGEYTESVDENFSIGVLTKVFTLVDAGETLGFDSRELKKGYGR
jgi:hypothetical protein